MSPSKWIVFGSLILASPVLAAGNFAGVCSADFTVKATMDSFVGHVISEPASVNLSQDDALTFTVGIANMATGKAKRDAAMFHMFSATNFPMIVGAAKTADINAMSPAGDTQDLPLAVTIHGVTQPLVAKVSNLTRSETNLVFDATFTVPLREFGLKPPSVMMMIRVDNSVRVVAHVALSK